MSSENNIALHENLFCNIGDVAVKQDSSAHISPIPTLPGCPSSLPVSFNGRVFSTGFAIKI
jgi:hypothetical protein